MKLKPIKIGLDIQQDQPDYTLPLILEKTGIDTSKFVSIDPYKITYEEFIKRQEAGEDMTPYYENQPTAKPKSLVEPKGVAQQISPALYLVTGSHLPRKIVELTLKKATSCPITLTIIGVWLFGSSMVRKLSF